MGASGAMRSASVERPLNTYPATSLHSASLPYRSSKTKGSPNGSSSGRGRDEDSTPQETFLMTGQGESQSLRSVLPEAGTCNL